MGAGGGDVSQGYLNDRQTLSLPWFQYAGGTLNMKLSGPGSPVDFDMQLDRWDGSTWQRVASSTGPTTAESISYAASASYASASYYRVTVYSYSGAGNYTLTVNK